MDTDIGSFVRADILIEEGRIAAIRPDIEAEAEVIDATGSIVMPGFVDTHRHCWQNPLRHFAPNAVVQEYGRDINRIGVHVRPEDVYAGTLGACLGALDSGVTTLLDWSHISNTPEHSDAAVAALFKSGIRGVYGYGQSRAGVAGSAYPDDLHRIKSRYFASDDQLVTVALGANIDRTANWPLARELGVRITAHVWPLWVMPHPDPRQRPASLSAAELVKKTHAQGLMGDDVTYIHCTGLDDEAWSMIADTGGSVSLSATSIAQFGVGGGIPPMQFALDQGIRPSLSVDTEVTLPTDFFSLMRVTLALQRGLANERRIAENHPVALLHVRDILQFATVEGAKALGLWRKIGSLSPGKEADIVILRAGDLNLIPLNNAIGSIVLGADRSNVDTVLVAGRVVKRHGRLVSIDTEALRDRLTASRDYLANASGLVTDILGDGYGL